MEKEQRLVCSQHGGQKPRMTEKEDNPFLLECPQCGYTFQNVFRDPMMAVYKFRTEQAVMRNVLTGEEQTTAESDT